MPARGGKIGALEVNGGREKALEPQDERKSRRSPRAAAKTNLSTGSAAKFIKGQAFVAMALGLKRAFGYLGIGAREGLGCFVGFFDFYEQALVLLPFSLQINGLYGVYLATKL